MSWIQDPLFYSISSIATKKWDRSDGYLGEGLNYEVRQRTVEINDIPTAVAVKRLKHFLPPAGTTFQSSSDFRNIRPFIRDVRVMQVMRDCPTIVDLLATDLEQDAEGNHVVPILTVELAVHGKLTAFLSISMPSPGTTMQTAVSAAFSGCAYTTRKSLVTDVAMALYFLHSFSIYHTDVKPDNVLVFESPDSPCGYRAKLSDFGSALIHDPDRPSVRFPLGREGGGTLWYVAPELRGFSTNDIMLLPDIDLRKGDIYSFGVLLAESLTSSFMANQCFIDELQSFLSSEKQDWIPNDETLRIKKLLEQCLSDMSTRFDGFHYILTGLQAPLPIIPATRPDLPSQLSIVLDTFGGMTKFISESLLEWGFSGIEEALRVVTVCLLVKSAQDEVLKKPSYYELLAPCVCTLANLPTLFN
jgi:serine/threonine protein kinase